MVRHVETVTAAGLPVLVSLEGADTRSAYYDAVAVHTADSAPKGDSEWVDVAGILSLSVLLAAWVVAVVGLGWLVARDFRRLKVQPRRLRL